MRWRQAYQQCQREHRNRRLQGSVSGGGRTASGRSGRKSREQDWSRGLTHEGPVLEEEEPGQGVEWDVAARALGVVVWAGHLGASRVEAAAGDGVCRGGHAHGGSGQHLHRRIRRMNRQGAGGSNGGRDVRLGCEGGQ